jgi:hypothetical protein
MLAYEAARQIAREHVDGLHPLPEGFVRRHTEGERVREGWYFDYGVEKVPPNPGGPGSGIGGAPGFLVTDNGEVRALRLGDLRAVFEGGTSDPAPPSQR